LESKLSAVLKQRESEIIAKWLETQEKFSRRMSASEQEHLSRSSRDLLGNIRAATANGANADLAAKEWDATREFLQDFSSSRAKEGYTPAETASFVFSLKQPLFQALGQELSKDSDALLAANWEATMLLDNLGLFTVESFQKTREDIISRQQQELLELSTPVVRLWENVLALPLIGTLDSARTQIVMQNLLDAIVETRSDFAIIDITGVPIVDTLVAQHLLKTVAAARLMGADCVISGIRPQIAQTIIHLGVDLSDVTTKATLADAFALVLRRSGQRVVQDDRPKPATSR